MSKYDFGYTLQDGTTNKWAYEQIIGETKVLELGSSVGCLTFNLSEYKKCNVDIIEIDEEAGKCASEFAQKALLGYEHGNLNNDRWYEELKGNKYDYIVALDVLEHLENPEHVLGLLKCILNKEGKIILSIPNIAHNAIVLELIQNKFHYSDLGLLDRTHVHFFAYESILEMVSNNGLYISVVDAIKKSIWETEFTDGYENIPDEVESFLRTRPNGDVYQFLLVIEKQIDKTEYLLGNGVAESSYYTAIILVDGLLKNQIIYPHLLEDICIDIDMTTYLNAESIRFVPVEQAALVSNLRIEGVDKSGNKIVITPNWTTGILINEQTIVLDDKKYEINFLLPENIEKIRITCRCVLIDQKIVNSFEKMQMQSNELQSIKSTRLYKVLSLFTFKKKGN